jgi:hypothetical protein
MSIYKKLFEAKKEIGKISKDSKNPFFKSNYLSLNGLIDAVEAVLENHDLLLLQPIEENNVCSYIVDINAKGDEKSYVKSSIELPKITDPQKLGSAITYYRRYTLQSLLGLQAEDDDGNLAAKPVDYTRQTQRINACLDIETLKKTWLALSPIEQTALKTVKDVKYNYINNA